MDIKSALLLGASSGVLLLCGCAIDAGWTGAAPVWESQFGQAVSKARAVQIIHPEGVAADDDGFSGKAAEVLMQGYYRAPPRLGQPGGMVLPGNVGQTAAPRQ